MTTLKDIKTWQERMQEDRRGAQAWQLESQYKAEEIAELRAYAAKLEAYAATVQRSLREPGGPQTPRI